MPSPFPGMDPFIEMQEWSDFHHALIEAISELLVPNVQPRYVVRVERRVYIEHVGEFDPNDANRIRFPDLSIVERGGETAATASSGTATIAPAEIMLPMPVERRESYLVVRDRDSREIVTLLELLSPANKRRGGDGREVYLEKREEVLQSRSHLIEIDLLRGGDRLPTQSILPPGDYYAIVSRGHRRPRADVFAWTLEQSLPTIPIPLHRDDGEAMLDLATAVSMVYDRKRYDLSLDYGAPLEPPLTGEQAKWVAQLLAKQ